ncbi:small redox-active disulfide protein 2 [Hydrogenispora ethanolica]|jgi:small redox-active disulfide protein 2|uniref:Small redox-active disulfide protein 2 n=1 Tax=Hydrogenispora ethanolica TaxID=1082276 RepID=A0A4R1R2X0_HYDET|nr:thioredoxin family protein [Hydrogenispora ethanolica]TCL59746.1 small redox-active disulfide protein 2 [Hydrogenispora ethanolica]
MEVKVLGSGCANCIKLEKLVTEVVQELGLPATVSKVTDIKEIMAFGVMSTPGLVVDGKVKCTGRIPSKDEIKKYLQGGSGNGPCGCNGNCCG